MRYIGRRRLLAVAFAALVIGVASASAKGGPPGWESITVDDTFLLPNTSAACGFDVYEHDFGTLKGQTQVMPDGSVRISDRAVHIDSVFFAPSTGESVLVHPGGTGGFTATLHPDGSVTLFAHGTDGMITVPGVGLVFASSGNSRVEISPTGDVVEIEHGNHSEDHSGLCPILAG
jgi:hypothetical protein